MTAEHLNLFSDRSCRTSDWPFLLTRGQNSNNLLRKHHSTGSVVYPAESVFINSNVVICTGFLSNKGCVWPGNKGRGGGGSIPQSLAFTSSGYYFYLWKSVFMMQLVSL